MTIRKYIALMRAGINLTSARRGGWTDGSSVVMHFTRI